MTALRNHGITCLVLVWAAAVTITGCTGGSDEHEATTAADTAAVDVAAPDTLTGAIDLSGIDRIEADRAEIQARLETLLAKIERKEKDLAERERALLAQTAALDRARERVRTLQTFSWIVLAIGAIAIFIGLRARAKYGAGPYAPIGAPTPPAGKSGGSAAPGGAPPAARAPEKTPPPRTDTGEKPSQKAAEGGPQTKRKTKSKGKSGSRSAAKSKSKSGGDKGSQTDKTE